MNSRLLSLALALALAPAAAHAQDAAGPATSTTARADVLVLKDGSKLVGEVVAESDSVVAFRADGVTRAYARDRIQSLEKQAADAPTGASDARPDAKPTDRPAAKPTDKAARKRAKAAKKTGTLSAPARAWLDALIDRSAEADPQVQRSLAAAMHALGPAAVVPLREAAASADGPTRLFLDRVARSIEENAKRKRKSGALTDRASRDMRGDRARNMRNALVEELSITPDQRPAFDSALNAAQERQRELGKSVREGTIDKEAARERVADVRAELLASMKGILDPAQYALYEEMSANYFAKMGKNKKPGKNAQ